nr:hypothetical protein [Chromatiaceae bacterium]
MPRRLNWISVLALALLPALAGALGLGGIRGDSALNEPLLARIELNGVAPQELDGVKVVLASEAEFTKVGSPRSDFLTGLVFVPEVSPEGKVQVRVTSLKPIREPYLDFLVEVTWPKGRLVKGYTVLLDPPTTLNRPAPMVTPPKAQAPLPALAVPSAATAAPVMPPATPQAASPPRPPVAAWPPASPRPPPPATAPGPTLPPPAGYPLRYGPVPSGSNLSSVARRMAPQGASQAQTALAIYRANPQAFGGGNINKLRAAARLEIPHPHLIFAYDAETAKQQFLAAQRGQPLPPLPGSPQDGAPGPGLEPIQDRLEIATREPGPAGEGMATAHVPATPPSGPPPATRMPSEPSAATVAPDLALVEREILLVREMAESGHQETADLRVRISRLEDHLADIKRLLELSNAQLAQLQGTGVRSEPAVPVRELEVDQGDMLPVPSPEPGSPAPTRMLEQEVAAVIDASGEAPADKAPLPAASAVTVATQAPAPSRDQPATEILASAAPAAAQPPATGKEPSGAPASAPPPAEPVARKSALPRLAVKPPPPEPSFLEDLSSWALVAGGPLLILLLGLLFLVRRQNQTKEAAGLVVAEATDREVLAEAETEEKTEEALDPTLTGTPSSSPLWPESPDLGVPLALALDATAKPSPAAPAKPSEEPYELDLSDPGGWDLGVHLPPNPPEPAPIAPTAAQETLDLMTPSLGNLILAPQAPRPEPESVLDLTAGDFDLDLESLGKLGAATGPAEGDQSHEPLVDLDLDLDDLMDLDLSAFASADRQADQAQAAPPSNPPLD